MASADKRVVDKTSRTLGKALSVNQLTSVLCRSLRFASVLLILKSSSESSLTEHALELLLFVRFEDSPLELLPCETILNKPVTPKNNSLF